MGRLDDKVAIVTGAGSGIGAAAARLFAAEGARVGVADLRGEAAEAVAGEITSAGGEARALVADVSTDHGARAPVDAVVQAWGRLDVLYNNAGMDATGDVLDVAAQDWERCFAVNVTGTWLCSKHAVPAMEAGGGGAIINQGSVAALVGIRRFAAYCAAKGAVVSLTRAMALDLAPRNVRVNCICPGTVLTPLMESLIRERGGGNLERGIAMTVEKYPLGRLGEPDDIARVALFLASDDAAFVTGSIYAADGGMTAQ
ncbi:MAG TPA: glucose 1-dehydrogenase [Solirubrobacteraceae bacterium]|nr:glucose 1-dehydrogenase [Solirubrobacteraceae bacterium]